LPHTIQPVGRQRARGQQAYENTLPWCMIRARNTA
jgi:hypothetical protein